MWYPEEKIYGGSRDDEIVKYKVTESGTPLKEEYFMKDV